MGSCMSTGGEQSDQRKRSNKIDKELEEDSKRLRKECKILLLGMSPILSLPVCCPGHDCSPRHVTELTFVLVMTHRLR